MQTKDSIYDMVFEIEHLSVYCNHFELRNRIKSDPASVPLNQITIDMLIHAGGEIENKYGLDSLELLNNDYQKGVLRGRIDALYWVLGLNQDELLTTAAATITKA